MLLGNSAFNFYFTFYHFNNLSLRQRFNVTAVRQPGERIVVCILRIKYTFNCIVVMISNCRTSFKLKDIL
jgi:hypothetical protein